MKTVEATSDRIQVMTPIGVVLAIATVLGGIVLKGSGIHSLWSAAALVVVFVGTASAILVQTPAATLKRALKMLPWVIKPPKNDGKATAYLLKLEFYRTLVSLARRGATRIVPVNDPNLPAALEAPSHG